MVANIFKKLIKRWQWLPNPVLASLFLLAMFGVVGCTQETSDEALNEKPSSESIMAAAQPSVPLVTMDHWKNSTPGERYAFLIGFITMLELEKEWQGRDGQEILSFEESLVPRWVEGLTHRPLAEIYNGLNRHVSDSPDELHRPLVEVMWFNFIEPGLNEEPPSKPALAD